MLPDTIIQPLLKQASSKQVRLALEQPTLVNLISAMYSHLRYGSNSTAEEIYALRNNLIKSLVDY